MSGNNIVKPITKHTSLDKLQFRLWNCWIAHICTHLKCGLWNSAYIKAVHQNSTSCNLIIGKSKLAPRKNKLVTILWFELLAALKASRIKITVLDQMDMAIDGVFLWSDSKTVLNHLRNTKTNFGPYIIWQCHEIWVNTRIGDWRYIPSEINIADILSCGITFNKFYLLNTWFTSPEFLASNNQN